MSKFELWFLLRFYVRPVFYMVFGVGALVLVRRIWTPRKDTGDKTQ